MIQYDPKFLDSVAFFSKEEKEELAHLKDEYPLSSLVNDPRTLEERSADYAYVSARIEGNSYTRKSAANLLAYGFTEGGKPFRDAVMLLNLRTAFAWVRLKAPEAEIFSKEFLFDLHRTVMANLLPESMLGAMRFSQVRIGGTGYVPPENPARLSSELDRLLSTSLSIDDPFERSVYVHLNLAYLQYFSDGNKRTARLMQTAFLV
ncbi:MAG: Fic family protein, partial [Sutterellaceae bacterium]|nr:Fic family protein [Sutterellaceae bacterium]